MTERICCNWRSRLNPGLSHADDVCLLCNTCKRWYCNYCFVDANDEFSDWYVREDGLLHTGDYGCDKCNYDYTYDKGRLDAENSYRKQLIRRLKKHPEDSDIIKRIQLEAGFIDGTETTSSTL